MKKFLSYGLIILTVFPLILHGQRAQRIVSLAPSITKNIYYLGAQGLLVGCTSYCTEALSDRKEVVANAVNVNIEKIVSLRPEVVLATPLTAPETVEMIKKFSIRVEYFPSPASFTEIGQQFFRLGELTGKEDRARQMVQEAREKVECLTLITHTPHRNVFFQIGADPLFTVLPGTFMDDYILLSGGRNIISSMSQGTLTRESVIAGNPDVIFIVTMGITGEEEKKIWERYKGLSAADHRQIHIIDAEKACSPTPVTFVETLDTICQLMRAYDK